MTPQTPGVYLNEVDALPDAVVTVPTAIPVFIGYTQRADYQGKSYYNQTVEIRSLTDFATVFGPDPGANPYAPVYHVVPSEGVGDPDLGGGSVNLLPDPGTIYYLYNSIKLFYANGGGTAYVVSVGPLAAGTGGGLAAGDPLVNPNVQYADLFPRVGHQRPRTTDRVGRDLRRRPAQGN